MLRAALLLAQAPLPLLMLCQHQGVIIPAVRPDGVQVVQPAGRQQLQHVQRLAAQPKHQQQLAAQVDPLAARQLHIVIQDGVAVHQHPAVQLNHVKRGALHSRHNTR